MTGSIAYLEVISTAISALIIIWILFQQNFFCKDKKKSKVVQYLLFALLLSFADIILHEIDEATPVSYIEFITSVFHLTILFLTINALVLYIKKNNEKK